MQQRGRKGRRAALSSTKSEASPRGNTWRAWAGRRRATAPDTVTTRFRAAPPPDVRLVGTQAGGVMVHGVGWGRAATAGLGHGMGPPAVGDVIPGVSLQRGAGK